MVFEDLFHSVPKKSQGLAPVVDRLLSVVLDFTLFWPFFTLILSTPLKKMQFRYYSAPDSTEFWLLLAVVVLGFFALTVAAQAIFISVLGATPGQMFFQLRVINTHTRRAPGLHAAVVRSVLFLLSFVTFGIPLLEVFSHRHRRLFHERATDTEVVTLKLKGMESPHQLEARVVRAVFTVCLAFVMTWGFATARDFYQAALKGVYKESELSSDEYLCADVPSREMQGNRLDSAIALFMTGSLSRECLETEADFAFWKGEKNDLAWASLAMMVLNDHDSAERKKYQEQSCQKEPGGSACELAVWWSSGGSADTPPTKGAWTRAVMGLRLAEKKGDSKIWQTELETLPVDFDIPEFVQVQRVKLLWARQDYDQARGGYDVIWDQLSSRPQKDLATNLCLAEVTDDCGVRPYKFCQDLESSMKATAGDTVVDSDWLVALAEDKACRKTTEPSFLSFVQDLDPDSPAGRLILSILPGTSMSEPSRLQTLRELAFQSSSDSLVRSRALLHLVRTSSDIADFEKARKIIGLEALPLKNELNRIFVKFAKTRQPKEKTEPDREPASAEPVAEAP